MAQVCSSSHASAAFADPSGIQLVVVFDLFRVTARTAHCVIHLILMPIAFDAVTNVHTARIALDASCCLLLSGGLLAL